MRENNDQKNSEYTHFSRSVGLLIDPGKRTKVLKINNGIVLHDVKKTMKSDECSQVKTKNILGRRCLENVP